MSSQHRLNTSFGEIEHTTHLSENIGTLYMSDDYSDITLIVCGQRFNAHKVILAARSRYFQALLYGGMKESSQTEIELKESSLQAFKGLLRYIYTGHMSLANQKEEVILDILGLAHQYGFVELESAISDYLKEILDIRNVCIIFDAARLYNLEFLTKVCCEFMDKNASDVIKHESFLQLSPTALSDLVARDSFYAPEVDIFMAVQSWVNANHGVDGSLVLDKVRLSLIPIPELLTIIRPTGLVSPEAILDAISVRTQSRDLDLNYRGRLLLDANVAHPQLGAQVLKGEMRNFLLDCDVENYDMEKGYTRHTIADSEGNCILVKLGTHCIINHMKMLLWDKDARSYSYYIEVSMDEKDWIRVIDHTQYHCRSWQYLFFEPRVVLYIRIVGTNNTVNKVFHVVSFEAFYTNHTEKLVDGFIAPTSNVATMEKSALVNEGVSRSRNTLLNGDSQNYDWDRGYTCHQLNSGCIQIQLGQPYVIDSMRLLLWDCDDRTYSYYIQVSGNMKNWEWVVDKTREQCHSWQTLHFSPPRPVVFIRIVGTHNTANEVFHCVHFECPAQVVGELGQSSQTNRPMSRDRRSLSIEDAERHLFRSTPPLPPPPIAETADEAVQMEHDDTDTEDGFPPGVDVGGQL